MSRLMHNNPERFAALTKMVLDDDRPQDPVLVIYGPMVPHAKIPDRIHRNGPRLENPHSKAAKAEAERRNIAHAQRAEGRSL